MSERVFCDADRKLVRDKLDKEIEIIRSLDHMVIDPIIRAIGEIIIRCRDEGLHSTGLALSVLTSLAADGRSDETLVALLDLKVGDDREPMPFSEN